MVNGERPPLRLAPAPRAQLTFGLLAGRPTAEELRQLISRYGERCPVCSAPLRALGEPARYVGCPHAEGLLLLATQALEGSA